MFRALWSIVTPLLLHLALSECTVILMTALPGIRADASLCTTVTAVFVIPVAVWMWKRDVQQTQNIDRLSGVEGYGVRSDRAGAGTVGSGRGKSDSVEGREVKPDGIKSRSTGSGIAGSPESQAACNRIPFDRRARYAVGCFVLGGILNLAWSRVLLLLGLQEHFSNAVQEQLFAGQLAVQVIGLGIVVPVAEELMFRALIYTRMKRLLTVRQAIFFSALLFAVYHGNVIQMVFVFPLALLLALVYEKGDWFGYPVSFHMGANLTAVLINILQSVL